MKGRLDSTDELFSSEYPGPHLVSRVVHSVVHPLKEAVRTVFVGAKSLVRQLKRSRVDEDSEVGTSEEKIAAEIAMYEYRRKLENTFGSSRRIDDMMLEVRLWTNDE